MEATMIAIFVIGYLAIAFEHSIHIDKSAPALTIGVLTWTVLAVSSYDIHEVTHHLHEHISEIGQILFFLLGAMTVVELIDSHNGFSIITEKITTKNKRTLLWIVSLLTFFLSAVLDNLATTIVMVSVIRKLVHDRESRLFFVSMVVIAANSGGAWSPIGDVTTTMLWIGNRITALSIIKNTLFASLVCCIVPLAVASIFVKGEVEPKKEHQEDSHSVHGHHHGHAEVSSGEKATVFTIGVLGLVFVPIFKTVTHLPPFMGIMLVLGIMWAVTELMHKSKTRSEKASLVVHGVLKKVDVPSILFFLGILFAVGSLQSAGILKELAAFLDSTIQNYYVISYVLGILSAIVDNVPLVAAAMGMYTLETYPTDHVMWQFVAYCAGTGGSSLIIGSAAGVAAMGMENIDFMWYLKKISWLSFIGYTAGAAFFLLETYLLRGGL
jgi:Na+/H+ antiporter NhaD/arsenite permease-like protein